MKTELLHKTKFLNFFMLKGTHKNTPFNWSMVTRHDAPKINSNDVNLITSPDCVHMICASTMTNNDGSVIPTLLVTKEYRHTIGTYEIGFPAGIIDQGESIVDAAKRELYEESGLKFVEINAVSKTQTSSSGLTDETFVEVFGKVEGNASNENLEQGEDIYSEFWTQEQVDLFLNMEQESLMDAHCYMVMELFAKTGVTHPSML